MKYPQHIKSAVAPSWAGRQFSLLAAPADLTVSAALLSMWLAVKITSSDSGMPYPNILRNAPCKTLAKLSTDNYNPRQIYRQRLLQVPA